MRKKPDIEQLQKIVGIRKLQQAAAHAAVSRTNIALSETSKLLKQSQEKRDVAERAWLDFVSAPSLPLEIMPLGSAAFLRSNKQVENDLSSSNAALIARDESIADFFAAERRSDAALDMAQGAFRQHLQKLENDAVSEAADRHLQQRRGL